MRLGEAELIVKTIERERCKQRMANDVFDDTEETTSRGRLSEQLTPKEMNILLQDRVDMMKLSDNSEESDQYRVYQYIIGQLEKGKWLRLMVQASAGTGKSFLLTTVYLWCLCKKMKVKACAPTGKHGCSIRCVM